MSAATPVPLVGRKPLPEWFDLGNCVGTDADLFFPELATPRAIRKATAVCDACEVRPQCLSYALECQEKGIWGGTTEDERRKMRDQRARQRKREAAA
jgi:WhiB family redox-sensing transcriptional regulator